MSEQEWKRLDAVGRVERGALTNGQAAQILGLSERQVRRMRRRVQEQGRAGVVHGNAGRTSAQRLTQGIRELIVELRSTKYAGFNDRHFTEKLVEVEQLLVSRGTVRRVLRAAGIPSPRRRRASKHRRRRERKAQEGLLLLWDGSHHDWLEGRGPMLCLMGAVDDATGQLLPGAHFVEQECAAGYLQVIKAIAQEMGLPWSLYMDRHGSLKRNDEHWTVEEELRGEQEPTQVGRALKALEIEVIYALSPQAKGRVERLWGTLQDRLVSELRLVGASTHADANAVLERFRPDYNRRFAVRAAQTVAAWRKIRAGTDLVQVCSFCYAATVLNDNTVRLGGVVIDIPPGPRQRSYAHARVEVRQLLDGSWRVYYRDVLIATAASTATGELRSLNRRRRWVGRATSKTRARSHAASDCGPGYVESEP